MADRTYDLLIDTPENRKIAETLRRYNNIKDTNGQPSYLWKVPHISGQPSLKGGCMCGQEMKGGAMPNSVLLQMDERQTLQRPRGMVSPYTQPPAKYILSGNRALYPQFNSVELDALNNRKVGSGILGSLAKQGAKTGAKYAVQGAKLAVAGAKQGAKIAVMVASNPAVQAVVGEIAKDPEVQKAVVGQITSMIKGKATENIVEDEPLEGGRIRRMLKKMRGGGNTMSKPYVLNSDNPDEDIRNATLAKDDKQLTKLYDTAIKKQKKKEIIKEMKDLKLSEKLKELDDLKKGKKEYKSKLTSIDEYPAWVKSGGIRSEKLYKMLAKERGELEGMGIKDGRAKRAEIVKKVMKEKGLKMIEASKYVKAHNLY